MMSGWILLKDKSGASILLAHPAGMLIEPCERLAGECMVLTGHGVRRKVACDIDALALALGAVSAP